MSKKSLIIPLIVLLAAAGLLFGIAGHWTGWQGNRPEQETDDAYLRADMTPLSTRISGTVRKVNVNDYQSVKAGQALIELDDEDYRALLRLDISERTILNRMASGLHAPAAWPGCAPLSGRPRILTDRVEPSCPPRFPT